ncbi:cilia- and flagella-associated protein 57 [Eurytemora carolleeae]|uniref:cilia- and flagella-associated protein 57 n=1 Tax=Eurytemora carolleeae TaxID=1294199 RepID=UPI000C792DF8|nr:cilia- and flagella-associated protein 57 [Eurytemora carolleeae]|eukprot:XP_023325857.1 cilia- and flagella-associated protein 57-like [Eurytemora affinis]
MSWAQDDLKIVSCAANGSLYDWNVASGERIHEVVVKSCSFTSLTVSPEGTDTLAVGSDSTLKQISNSRLMQELDLHTFTLSAISLSTDGKILVSGTTTGTILFFKYPLTLPGEWKEFKMHGDQVNFVKISHTNDIIVSASLDGSFCIWKLPEENQEALKYNYAREILITKSELESKNSLIEELKQKVDESKTECTYQLRLKDNQNSDLIKEINKKTRLEKEQLAQTISRLQAEVELQRKTNSQQMEQMKTENERRLLDLQDLYKDKLVTEYQKYGDLEQSSEALKMKNKTKIEHLEKAIESKVGKIKEEFEAKIQAYNQEMMEKEKAGEESIRAIEEVLKQTEEDADKEILELKIRYEDELRKERESNVRLRGELGILKKKQVVSQKDLEEQKDNLTSLSQDLTRLETKISNLEKDKLELKKEIKSRDNIILSKEKDISELKSTVRSMEKYKYVLNHKIGLLEEEIIPKDSKINEMKAQILAMEAELTSVVKDHQENSSQINDTKVKLVSTNLELVQERKKLLSLQNQIIKIHKEIQILGSTVQDPKRLKETVSTFCKKFTGDKVRYYQDEENPLEDVLNQKVYLENKVSSLHNQLHQVEESNKKNAVKLLNANKFLLKEMEKSKKK